MPRTVVSWIKNIYGFVYNQKTKKKVLFAFVLHFNCKFNIWCVHFSFIVCFMLSIHLFSVHQFFVSFLRCQFAVSCWIQWSKCASFDNGEILMPNILVKFWKMFCHCWHSFFSSLLTLSSSVFFYLFLCHLLFCSSLHCILLMKETTIKTYQIILLCLPVSNYIHCQIYLAELLDVYF